MPILEAGINCWSSCSDSSANYGERLSDVPRPVPWCTRVTEPEAVRRALVENNGATSAARVSTNSSQVVKGKGLLTTDGGAPLAGAVQLVSQERYHRHHLTSSATGGDAGDLERKAAAGERST